MINNLPNPKPTYAISLFDNLGDNQPKLRNMALQPLLRSFATHVEVASKASARLFTPGKYIEGGFRRATDVEHLSMLVLDFDKGHHWSDFVDQWTALGLTHLIYTTFNHTEDVPRWRAVFPLKEFVRPDEWGDTWRTLHHALGHGLADPAAKDVCRFYYVPSCAPGAPRHSEYFEGELLDVAKFERRAKEQVVLEVDEQKARNNNRVGDDFESRVSIDDILGPHGWDKVSRSGPLECWRRPGKKDEGISATWGYRPGYGDRFYCFSSEAGLPVGQLLTKFGIYSHLNHGGDFKAAKRELEKRGYGKALALVAGGNERRSDSGVPTVEGEAIPEWTLSDMTDQANAERLFAEHGKDILYVVERKLWAIWSGCRWEMSLAAEGRVQGLAIQSARNLELRAKLEPDEKVSGKILAWAAKSQNARSVSATLLMLKNLCAVSVNEFDSNPMMLNCPNGMVDLLTGKLLPHDKSALFSQVTSCEYSEDAPLPEAFNKFLAKVQPDLETREYLLRYLGYTLSGRNDDQSFMFAFGSTGNNGKSTLLDLMCYLMGDFAVTIETEAVMLAKYGGSNSDYEIARTRGKRLVVGHEVSDSMKLNEPLMKRLTGGDMVTARMIYEMPIEFRSYAHYWFTGNNKPAMGSQDIAVWRRIRLVPFSVTVAAQERDTKLIDKLKSEGPAILRQLVANGIVAAEKGMHMSEIMLQEIEDYKEENDVLRDFFSDKCAIGVSAETSASDLCEAYNEWAKARNAYTYTPVAFGRIMGARAALMGLQKVKDGTTGRVKYKGILLIESL
jgi:putative DNA primase/helicase